MAGRSLATWLKNMAATSCSASRIRQTARAAVNLPQTYSRRRSGVVCRSSSIWTSWSRISGSPLTMATKKPWNSSVPRAKNCASANCEVMKALVPPTELSPVEMVRLP